ncbi:hypothetical protein SM436_30370 [Actinomadura chokoriensis]|uniref:Uncharacterized protein n=1 Tax=Actinomadura chokoriensis TaxID=454156 RepID=A0ABV4R522_9ACTN
MENPAKAALLPPPRRRLAKAIHTLQLNEITARQKRLNEYSQIA